MIGTWHNNRISEKLNKEYPRDFSICDIDGLVRTHYSSCGKQKTRLILYESKNQSEKIMGDSQRQSLEMIDKSIDWSAFDECSGVYVIKIIDIENSLDVFRVSTREHICNVSFEELYQIFSAKKSFQDLRI